MMSPAVGCQRCGCSIEVGDLRCAICGLSTPHHVAGTQAVEVRVLRCDGCGAAVSYDVEAQAPRCAFCASVMHVEGVTDPMEQTEWYLSFVVPPDSAREALKSWMSSLGFFRPSDLRTGATIEKLEPLWWPGWVFNARALVSWAVDSNAGAGRAAWAPHTGQAQLTFERIQVSASRGLNAAETAPLRYDLNQGAAQPAGPEGVVVEQFDVQRSSARDSITRAAQAIAADRVVRTQVPGTKYRNLNLSLLLEGLETRRCSFPAYVLAYRYRNRLYRAVVGGQDAQVVGNAPYSVAKILAVVFGGLALVAAIVAVVLAST